MCAVHGLPVAGVCVSVVGAGHVRGGLRDA